MKNIKKIKKIKEAILNQEKVSLEEASSNLLNFIVKSKRDHLLKNKIQKALPKNVKKIAILKKKILKRKK